MKNILYSTLCAATIILCGCSDPADKVSKATTSAATNAAAAAPADAGREFVLLPDSKIEFIGSKVTGSHNGGFKTFEGTFNVAGGKIVGSPQVKIDMTSTWSDSDRLTGHLKNADFFDVAKYPTSTFTVTRIEGEGDNSTIHGNLELHGVTKAISFPAKVHVSEDSAHIAAEFAINRKDFQINYPGKTDDLIRDNVVIKLDLKAAPAVQPKAA